VADQTVVLDDRDLLVVEGSHAGRFLAPVLQRVERVVADVGHVASGGDNGHDAAGFLHAPSIEWFIDWEGTKTFSHNPPAP
jgi:hypothetical protein